MASSTYQTYLMVGDGEDPSITYSKLIDIKDFPDLGGPPEQLETTTLSDDVQTFTPGIQSLDAMSFTCNYDKTEYDKVKEMEGEIKHLAVFFGGPADNPTGEDGKWGFDGEISVYAAGKGVNEVREMIVTITPSTPIKVISE